jgi:hypothetical protein
MEAGMAHLTIQIGASIVIPMPKQLRRRGGRSIRRMAGAPLRWQAIREAALLGRLPDEGTWGMARHRCVYRDQAMRQAFLAKKGKLS